MEGIQDVGISAYQQASNTSSPQEAARILEDAKTEESLTLNNLADRYQEAYTN
jgi:hypothetical protein